MPDSDDESEFPTVEEIVETALANRYSEGFNLSGLKTPLTYHRTKHSPPKKRQAPQVDRTVLLPVANLRLSAQILSETDVVRQYKTVYNLLIRFKTLRHRELYGKPTSAPKSNQKIDMWKRHASVLLAYWLMLRKRMEDENFGITAYYGTSYNPFATVTFNPSPLPPWFGNPEIHASHRAFLLKRNPEHYGQFQWPEKPSSRLKFPQMTTPTKKSVSLVSQEE